MFSGGRVAIKNQPGPRPRHFQPVDHDTEIETEIRVVGRIGQPVIGKPVEPWPEQQSIPLHGGKILAIDPDEVDRTAFRAPGGFLGKDAGDGFRRIRQLHMHDRDTESLTRLFTGPVDIGIDPGITAPGIPVNGLPPCGLEHFRPFRRGIFSRALG